MATTNKDFKVKSGLVVEGATGTINGSAILTKSLSDQNYIIGLIGGSATSTNTPDSVVLRDNAGSFAAQDLTLDGTLYGTSISSNGTITITSSSNDIVLDADGWVYAGNATSSNIVATRGRVDSLIGDPSVDSSTGNTITDRIATAKSEAVSEASGYADSLASNYDPAGAATTAENNAKGYADSLATNYDPAGSASGAYNNATSYTDTAVGNHASSTSTHGVTGNIVGTTDVQSLSNKTFLGQTVFQSGGGAGGSNNHIDVDNSTGKMTITSGYALDVVGANDVVITSNSGDIVLNPDGNAYVGSASAGNEIATNSYVDNAVSGLTWKQAVNLLAHTNLALTGDATTTSVDGHSLSAANGYRILLSGQSTNSENGIYDIAVATGTYTLTRAADADTYTELVGAAVFVMEGTQYGQTSWVQSNHYLADFTSQTWTQFSGGGSVVAGNGIIVDGLEISIDTDIVATQTDLSNGLGTKQDTLTAGEGIYIDGSNTITGRQQSGGGLKFVFNEAAIDRSTVDGWYDASGAATTAENNAKSYADDVAFTAEQNANSYTNTAIGNIDLTFNTDEISEGATNKYFTDGRAKSSAADLLTNATLTNITITGTGAGLTITAENGVADSDTDDLAEGTTNLYFTNQRAIDALEAVTPNFVEVDLNSLATQVAATTGLVATASTVTAYAFPKADYRSAKFLVKTAYGTHTEVSEVLLTLDTLDNISITEYAIVGTNGSSMTVTADVNGTDVRLRVTTVNNNSTVTVVGTLLV